MKQETTIIFDELPLEEYNKLLYFVEHGKEGKRKPTYDQILKSINKAIICIKDNPYYGDIIPKKYLNKDIIRTYKTNKILRIELVGFWRLLYTIRGDEVRVIAFILDFMDHEEYSRLFKYKKK